MPFLSFEQLCAAVADLNIFGVQHQKKTQRK